MYSPWQSNEQWQTTTTHRLSIFCSLVLLRKCQVYLLFAIQVDLNHRSIRQGHSQTDDVVSK